MRRSALPAIPLALCLALAACKPAAAPDAASEAATAPAPAPATDATPSAPVLRNPLRDAKAEVAASMEKLAAVRSYHATMTAEGKRGTVVSELDFVAPDRYRIVMPRMGAQTIVGDTMYMTARGRTMKVPLPAGTLTQWRDPTGFEQARETMQVQAQGNEDIDGRSTRKFLMQQTTPRPGEVTLWLGADDLPVRVQVRGQEGGDTVSMTIDYSRFDDPAIAIEPPQ